MGLQDILKVLVGMLLVVRVFCRPASLMCNEALNGGGGGGLNVYLGAMIL